MNASCERLCIGKEDAQFFLDNGYLILRGVVTGEELRQLQASMNALTIYGSETVRNDPDFMYGAGHKTGRPVLRRIEYVIDKSDSCKALLGHPFILRSVEKIIGKDLIPTWDSMVLKMPGEGIIVPWHRDAGTEFVGDVPIFNVDFYLDEADLDTCVWVYPGSHLWEQARVQTITQAPGFSTEGAVPVPMQPGDVLFHNILVLHGSPANASDKLRRVIYYEFRAAHIEAEIGPHVPAYIPLKQEVLLRCLALRAQMPWAADEQPYVYDPPEPFAVNESGGGPLVTFRYPHEVYFRR